jgi:fumarate reductase flavoprotein subunit
MAILNVLKPIVDKEVVKGSITVLLETSANDLIQSANGEINGVVVTNNEGKTLEYKGQKIILASGGCASNPRLYEELHDVPLYCQMAYPESQGAGLILGQSVGGYLRGGEKYSPLYGMILSDNKVPSTPYAVAKNVIERLPWEILVNSQGKRFVQEDHESVDYIEHLIGDQPAHRHWAILDQHMLEQMPQLIYDWSNQRIINESNNQVMFKTADSIRNLAIQTGLHPLNLLSTIQDYNQNLENGSVDTFGRQYRPLAIKKGPFYSIRMSGWSLCSFAGLGVNGNFEVTKSSGEPIKNLYAIGEVIGFGATSGNAYVNGMGVTPALTYGKLLGERI